MRRSSVTLNDKGPVYLAADGAVRDPRITTGRSQLYVPFGRKLRDQVGHSSVAGGWLEDVVVERWSLPPTEGFKATMARHRLSVLIGASPVFGAWNDDGGHTGEGPMAPGGTHLLPQGLTCQTRWSQTLDIASFEFSSSLIERLLDGRAPSPSEQFIPYRNVPDPVAYDLTRGILAELAAPTERVYGEMLCVALAVHLLLRSGRTGVDAARFKGRLSSAQARRVLDYIHANLDGHLSVSGLARQVGLSDAYFARAFRSTFNEPPHRLILRWRLERAVRLVSIQGFGLADAAIAVGFCDQAHFTNSMRRYFGVTPRRLLKS